MPFKRCLILFVLCCAYVDQSYSASWDSPIAPRQTTLVLCNESSAWQPTTNAYVNADTDKHLAVWWENITAHGGGRFDNNFGQLFGYNNFRCGISTDESCSAPSCFGIEGLSDPPWIYLAAMSIQNLNSMFNAIYNGVGYGQEDFSDLTDNLADNFFHWQDPLNIGAEVSYWVGAAITTICSFIPLPLKIVRSEIRRAALPADGAGNFLNAAAQQTAQSLQPLVGLNRETGISGLKVFALEFSQAARNGTETWADTAFSGLPDTTGKIILDYLQGGSFVDSTSIPNNTEVEVFYKSALTARTINAQWRLQSIYLVAATGDANSFGDYPADASFKSRTTGRTYVPYYFDGKSQQEPPGLSLLNQSYYGIRPSQVAESSARAWEYAGNNYTTTLASQRIQSSLSSNGALTPFQDGPGWEGVFTLPACDVGSHAEWLVPFGGKLLPCCCGKDCADTKAFVQAANLNKSEDFLDICRTQLKGTNIDFNSIDYGINSGSKIHQFWHHLGKGGKAGFVIGIFFGVVLIIGSLGPCVEACD